MYARFRCLSPLNPGREALDGVPPNSDPEALTPRTSEWGGIWNCDCWREAKRVVKAPNPSEARRATPGDGGSAYC